MKSVLELKRKRNTVQNLMASYILAGVTEKVKFLTISNINVAENARKEAEAEARFEKEKSNALQEMQSAHETAIVKLQETQHRKQQEQEAAITAKLHAQLEEQ